MGWGEGIARILNKERESDTVDSQRDVRPMEEGGIENNFQIAFFSQILHFGSPVLKSDFCDVRDCLGVVGVNVVSLCDQKFTVISRDPRNDGRELTQSKK